jgi:PAS domain S-box-containing protein
MNKHALNAAIEPGGETVVFDGATDRYRRLVESASEGIVAVDGRGAVDIANAAAGRILGCEPRALIGRAFHNVVHPRHARERWPHAHTLCPLGALLEMQSEMPQCEESFARADGTMLRVQCAGSLLSGSGAVVTFSDITERKALEVELERANRMEGLGHVAATIAHEFNNVLMGIQPFLDLLVRRAAGRGDMAEPLSRIAQSLQRGKRVALEILRFSQPMPARTAPMSLQPFLRDVAAEAAALLGSAHTVALDLPPSPFYINADRELLHQLFANLVANARDAMPAPGTVRIAVQRCTPEERFAALVGGGFVGITVSDNGRGMSEETLKHAFEPLFTTRTGRGTGLGLAVVHQIVTAHGGYIFADSRPGEGATFTIFLPLITEAA